MSTVPRGQSSGGPGRAPHLCGLVQPDHSVVRNLVASATGIERPAPRQLVERLCEVLGTWRFEARFGPSSLDRIGIERAGNCIDLSAVLCAALRHCGVQRCYVLLGSRSGQFPAGVHAWVLASAGSGTWVLVDPDDFRPQSCDPRSLPHRVTLLAVFNDKELIVGREQHAAFFAQACQGGDV